MQIKNMFLPHTIKFLNTLKLSRMFSVHRRRLIKLLTEHHEEYEEERIELIKEHAKKDDAGNPIIIEEEYQIKDKSMFTEDIKQLNEEGFYLDKEKHKELIKTMQKALHQFISVEYEGWESEVYDSLCDVFSVDELGYKEEKNND